MDLTRIREHEAAIKNAEKHIAEIEIGDLLHRRVGPNSRLDEDCTAEVLLHVKATMELRKREVVRLRSYAT
ncbi:hypothetical protein [Shinella zoogloeoides]|uniref:Uncharacterized protein n=1 Tax=Shinella zoogloeoides TaxID=352475 RepID=A0A6N8TIE2_SHIZO|nr:hypothetical protein [Shinella zoogloeoides]MXO03023.1 hypothetical protein [Shinella zoogloeoides]UEX80981.1 hypothetical protein K8M09_15530 [Shinella zoogloeoides]